MNEPLLRARGLRRSYRSGERSIVVLRGLDLDVAAGEAVAVVGDSGVGKSTLLHLLGGLDRPDAGQLLFRGEDLLAASPERIAAYRNLHIGFVFQFHHLLPEFDAIENVEMPFRIGRRMGGAREAARELLVRLGLADRLSHRPGQLSGGELQRVAIARAVVTAPSLVLADEPTGNLDPATGQRVFGLFRELQREREFALVLVSHNERLARECDRVLRLEDGGLTGLGEAETREYFRGLGVSAGLDPML